MDTEHDTDIMTKEALEFGEWVSRVAVPALLRRRTRLSERRARARTLRDNMDNLPQDGKSLFNKRLRYHIELSLITIGGAVKQHNTWKIFQEYNYQS